MEQYGVLIVDDSAFMRRAIGLLFKHDPQFYIVGIASSGEEALEKIERFKPDVVILDPGMRGIDCIEALRLIMKKNPVPVVMLGNRSGDTSSAASMAIELGAVDFFYKGELLSEAVPPGMIQDFLKRVKAAAQASIIKPPDARPVRKHHLPVDKENEGHKAALVVIGCSTGGPPALLSILPLLPATFAPPVLVVQHLPPGYTKPLTDRFNRFCRLRVKEAEHGERLCSGCIYVAPSGFQTVLHRQPDGSVSVTIETGMPDEALYRPSVDEVLYSAAPIYGDRLLAVILTGTGMDGLNGCREVKKNGGQVLVEAEPSCSFYETPKAVYEAGLADRCALLPNIMQHIISYC
ncbi:MAG: two-component system protein-glutamate methylesterase response regulator [Paenibacillus sp.]|jgi:two-component system chemotaxis response regulator CheB|nr:two-component system protein-glutamate methylesterase response regulator [Paenibacillus sp.]